MPALTYLTYNQPVLISRKGITNRVVGVLANSATDVTVYSDSSVGGSGADANMYVECWEYR